MLHQRYKDIAFWAIAKAALPNYLLHRYLLRGRSSDGSTRLHLGCGTKYLPGFVNIDGNPFNKSDLWLDVRNGLPFPSNSVGSIYSTHMFEHFYPDELNLLLRECLRVLKPGGGVRLIVPNLESAIEADCQSQSSWFSDSFPVISILSAAGFPILFSAMDSTAPPLTLLISTKCSGNRVSGKLRDPQRGLAACTRPMFHPTNLAIRWSCPIRCTSRHLSDHSSVLTEPMMENVPASKVNRVFAFDVSATI